MISRIKNNIWLRFIAGVLASLLISAFIVLMDGTRKCPAGYFLPMAVDAYFFVQPAVFLIFWFGQKRTGLRSLDFGLYILFSATLLLRMKL